MNHITISIGANISLNFDNKSRPHENFSSQDNHFIGGYDTRSFSYQIHKNKQNIFKKDNNTIISNDSSSISPNRDCIHFTIPSTQSLTPTGTSEFSFAPAVSVVSTYLDTRISIYDKGGR